MIELTRYSFSARAIFGRFRATEGMTSRWLNLVRAVSTEGFGRLNYYREIRARLDNDPQFPPYFEQESDQLPKFYSDQVCKGLGTLLCWLPIGAMNHDPYSYLKSERSAGQIGQRSRRECVSKAAVLDGRRKRSCLPAIVAPLTAAVSAISTPARAILFGPGFVYIEGPAVQVAAIQRGNGFLPLAVDCHLHESKPSGLSGVPISNDVYAVNRPKLLEQGSNGAFSGFETEISYKNILHLVFFPKLAEQQTRAG